MTRLVTPIMIEQQAGSIVNVSTFAAFEPDPDFPTSAVFRAGLADFAKLFSHEVRSTERPHEQRAARLHRQPPREGGPGSPASRPAGTHGSKSCPRSSPSSRPTVELRHRTEHPGRRRPHRVGLTPTARQDKDGVEAITWSQADRRGVTRDRHHRRGSACRRRVRRRGAVSALPIATRSSATRRRASTSGSGCRTTRPTTVRSPTTRPTSTTGTPTTTRGRPRSGRSCALRLPGRPLGALRRHVGPGHPRDRARGRLRHRETSPVATSWSRSVAPAISPCRHRSAALRRSRVTRRSTRWRVGSCCLRSPRSRSNPGRTRSASSAAACFDDMGEITPRRDGGRRRGAVRAAHPGQRDRQDAGVPRRGRGAVPQVSCTMHWNASPRKPGTREGMDDLGKYIAAQIEDHRENPRDDLTSYLMNAEPRRQQAVRRPRGWIGDPAAHRRDRHHVVGDRFVAVAPRPAPRRPEAPRRRPRRHAVRRRGSSCAHTPRSRWPVWSRRTTTSTAAR